MSLQTASAANANAPEYSVSEIAGALKRTVEDAFGHVRVRGELSGVKRAGSGHLYLCLKDETAILDGVMWKGGAAGLRFRPEDGLEVIVTGRLTTYPGRSKYQIIIERMEPAGIGALMALLEQRKIKLAAEGLFAPERKRPLPFLPRTIGIVTSPTGAVIRDILHRLADRFPRHVILWPVLVQGEGAAEQVARAVHGFNTFSERPDLLIVARGGGSIEDLWAFNEEIVVRAVAESGIPVISAVGHETDTTLVDFASDRRAPTPTAAAEMAVPVRDDLIYTIGELALRMDRAAAKGASVRAERVVAVAARLPHPRELFGLKQQRCDELAERLPRALTAGVQIQRTRYTRIGAALRPVLLANRAAKARDRLGHHAHALICAHRDRVAAAHRRLEAQTCRLRPFVLQTTEAAARARLDTAARLLETLSHRATLARGYAVVRDRAAHVVTGAVEAVKARALEIEFADGRVDVSACEPMAPAPRPKSPPRPASPADMQGVLL